MPTEVEMAWKGNVLVPQSDDIEALLRDARRYRRGLRQLLKTVRSGTVSLEVRQSIAESHERLAEACERRAAELRQQRKGAG